MEYNPSTFQYIKKHPGCYNILFNNILYTVKPSEHGLGLFAGQDIPNSAGLGYACNLSNNMYPYYLQTKCNMILQSMKGRNVLKRFNIYYKENTEEIHESIIESAVQDHQSM